MWDSFDRLGWKVFDHDSRIFDWAQEAKLRTINKLRDKKFVKNDLRCGGTWFPGVRFLDNNDLGSLGSIKLEGNSVSQIIKRFGDFFDLWDPAQISIVYPGYPKKMESESENAFKFRRERFGSHVDGVLPIGKNRRRFVKEFHTFIYGISISDFDNLAAPLIVWESSHHIFKSALEEVLLPLEPAYWPERDITTIYNQVRKVIFKKCTPRVIWVPIGSSFIIHRLCLHGVVPWNVGAFSEPSGRMIAYFRPDLKNSERWLDSSF